MYTSGYLSKAQHQLDSREGRVRHTHRDVRTRDDCVIPCTSESARKLHPLNQLTRHPHSRVRIHNGGYLFEVRRVNIN